MVHGDAADDVKVVGIDARSTMAKGVEEDGVVSEEMEEIRRALRELTKETNQVAKLPKVLEPVGGSTGIAR